MEMQAKFNRRIDDIQRRLRECNFECNELKELFAQTVSNFQTQLEIRLATSEPEELVTETPVEEVLNENVAATPVLQGPVPLEEPVTPEESPIIESVAPVESVPDTVEEAVVEAAVSTPPPLPKAVSARPKEAPKAKATKAAPAERPKRNMEKFIGENLLNKIGIGILVIGVGIFVKYAIDQDWIGSIGRVLIGLLTGGALLGIAHKLRKTYKSFSSVLVGGGIATLYFTVAIAFQTYGLLSQPVAFALMCGITAFGVLMATSYNRLEIAVIALIGGFATPFMVAKGEGNYVTLFSYLLVLNIGALVLSWFRGWKAVRVLSYAFTTLLFAAWMGMEYTQHGTIPAGGIPFATAFFAVFFLSNIAFPARSRKMLNPFDFMLLLANSALYYAAVMGILYQIDGGAYMGLFSALIGVFHFAFIFPAKKYVSFDKRLVSTLVGLVLTFVTASVVIQLEGRHAATFWAIEAVVLLLLSRKTGLKVMQNASGIVSALSVLALGRDCLLAYGLTSGPAVSTASLLMTSLVSAAALLALHFLHRKQDASVATIYRIAGLVVLFIAGALQVNLSLQVGYPNGVVAMGLLTYTVYFVAGLGIWARLAKEKEFGAAAFVLAKITFALFLLVQVSYLAYMREAYAIGWESGAHFPLQFLMVPGLFALLALNFAHGRKQYAQQEGTFSVLIWATIGLFILLCSVQLDNLFVMGGVELRLSHRIGYPILWGAIGFGLVALGLKQQLRQVRIAGLALFLLIVLKLFLYDVWTMPTGGKIAAFISLGVILLVASFMYQRIKKLVVNEEVST